MVRGRTLAVLAAAYWAYFTNGVLNSIIGPALLGMVHTFHIDLAAAGAIVTAQFIGYVPGALGSGLAAEHWGHRQVLVAAMVLTTAGALGTALAGAWVVVLLLTPVAGIGFGISDSLCNAVVAHATQGAQGATMNLLHMFFGVGALAGPLLAGVLLSSPVGWQGIFAVTGALAAVAALAFLVVPLPARSRRDADPVRQAPSIARVRRPAPVQSGAVLPCGSWLGCSC